MNARETRRAANRQIRELLKNSMPAERKRIRQIRQEGRQLRQELLAMDQQGGIAE